MSLNRILSFFLLNAIFSVDNHIPGTQDILFPLTYVPGCVSNPVFSGL